MIILLIIYTCAWVQPDKVQNDQVNYSKRTPTKFEINYNLF